MQFKKQLSKKQVLLKLASYAAYQERCISDIETQLHKYDLTNEEKAELITELIDQKYIDELRYAQSTVRGKFNVRSWGKTKIKFYLSGKRIEKYQIEKALKEIPFNKYISRCEELAVKKKASLEHKKLTPEDLKQKTIAYLLQKGYEYEVIKECL